MKPVIILMIAAILVLFLHCKNNTVNIGAKKAQLPVKPTKVKRDKDYLLYSLNLRFRLF